MDFINLLSFNKVHSSFPFPVFFSIKTFLQIDQELHVCCKAFWGQAAFE